MAAAKDRELARNFQQNEIATSAYAAAEKPFTESILGNPDAALALELQKMEVKTPLPPIADEDSERVAWQLHEQEHFEQEQHDADVAQRIVEDDERSSRRPGGGRVNQLNEALQGMHRNSPSPDGGMNFSRSVRGPSMMGMLEPSDTQLAVFGPASIIDHFSDNSDSDNGENREPTILPRPRQRPSHRPVQGQHRLLEGQQRQPLVQPRRPRDDLGLLPGHHRSPAEQQRQPPLDQRRRPYDDLGPLPGQFRQPFRGPPPPRQVHNAVPHHHGLGGRIGAMLGFAGGNHRNNYQRDNDIDIDGADYEALWDLQERNGDVMRKGLTGQQIGRIPYHKFKSKPQTKDSSVSEKDCCRICLCEYKDGENVKTLPCFHSYHKTCIDKWLKREAVCPVCRENIRIH